MDQFEDQYERLKRRVELENLLREETNDNYCFFRWSELGSSNVELFIRTKFDKDWTYSVEFRLAENSILECTIYHCEFETNKVTFVGCFNILPDNILNVKLISEYILGYIECGKSETDNYSVSSLKSDYEGYLLNKQKSMYILDGLDHYITKKKDYLDGEFNIFDSKKDWLDYGDYIKIHKTR